MYEDWITSSEGSRLGHSLDDEYDCDLHEGRLCEICGYGGDRLAEPYDVNGQTVWRCPDHEPRAGGLW